MADALATVHQREIERVLGLLPDMTAVNAALRVALGL